MDGLDPTPTRQLKDDSPLQSGEKRREEKSKRSERIDSNKKILLSRSSRIACVDPRPSGIPYSSILHSPSAQPSALLPNRVRVRAIH